MKKILLPLFATILLASCARSAAGPATVRWEQLMENPLFAQRYWDDLTDRMTTLQMTGNQTDQGIIEVAQETARNALARSQEISALKRQGRLGSFTRHLEDAEGWALLLQGKLYLSSDFLTYPGPSLNIYLSPTLDPREGTFPDAGSIEVGRLESPYGAQTYILPIADTAMIRSVVLYDKKLKRIYGFAQL